MKKYLGLFKNAFQSALEYRAYSIGVMIYELVSLGGVIILWTSVFGTNAKVAGYDFSQAILYYLLIPFVASITFVFVSGELSRDIREGRLSNYLLKPYKIWFASFLSVLAQKINYILIATPVYIAIFLVYLLKIKDALTVGNILFGVIVAFLAMLMHFSIDLFITWISFWTSDIWCFVHVKFILFSIFGGLEFPLTFLPSAVKPLFEALPFKYLYFVPVSYMIGERRVAEYFLKDVLTMFLWAALFLVLGAVLWKKGLKKYEAFGN